MIEAEKVAEFLASDQKLMETLKGQKLAGYALIIPPDGEPIKFVSIASKDDEISFFKYLADKITGSREQNQYGGVRMPQGMR